MLVLSYTGFNDAKGDGSERVVIDPNPGTDADTNHENARRRLGTRAELTDGSGNKLPDRPHDAGSLYAPFSNAPAGNTAAHLTQTQTLRP